MTHWRTLKDLAWHLAPLFAIAFSCSSWWGKGTVSYDRYHLNLLGPAPFTRSEHRVTTGNFTGSDMLKRLHMVITCWSREVPCREVLPRCSKLCVLHHSFMSFIRLSLIVSFWYCQVLPNGNCLASEALPVVGLRVFAKAAKKRQGTPKKCKEMQK